VLVAFVLNLAFASSINDSFLLLGRFFRFPMLFELVVLAFAYRAWRRPRARPQLAPFVAFGLFVAIALASSFWSARTVSTEKRSFVFLLLALATYALASATAARPEAVRRIFEALVAAAALVALLGLYMLWVSRHQAVQSASLQYPARYRGIGQNPNTVPLLLSLVLPLALWLWTETRRRGKVLLAGTVLLFDGSIVASGSRGALIAALAGTTVWIVTLARPWRLRLALLGVTAVVFVADVVITQIPKPVSPSAVAHSTVPHKVVRDAELVVPLADELGRPGKGAPPIRRTLLGTSGRARAWDAGPRPALVRRSSWPASSSG